MTLPPDDEILPFPDVPVYTTATMHIPPGVEVLVDECFGDDGESPAVSLKELLTIMTENGITTAGVVALSESHLIVVGYRDLNPGTPNAKSSPATRPGSSKR